MTETNAPANVAPTLVAVIVLYRTTPAESSAFVTLSSLLAQGIVSPGQISCVVYDNGPTLQEVPVQSFPVIYHHDRTNPGLAAAYNFALQIALQQGAAWLLVLDQDTQLTETYLSELVRQEKAHRQNLKLVALVPKLLQGDLMLSPHWPPRHPGAVSLRERRGPMEPSLQVFNSGALLRVSALEAIGGFPPQFPLDYLDHAVFNLLQKTGRVFLLQAELQHNLASLQLDLIRDFSRLPRLQSILRAESRFYRTFGTVRDRCVYALRRSRLILRMIAAGNLAGAALLLRCTFNPE